MGFQRTLIINLETTVKISFEPHTFSMELREQYGLSDWHNKTRPRKWGFFPSSHWAAFEISFAYFSPIGETNKKNQCTHPVRGKTFLNR